MNIKYKNGEVLSKEEEELISDKINIKRNEKIESDSNMLVTNIPPRLNTNHNIDEKKSTENINISYSNKDIFYRKLPKIKTYRSLFMKNFYVYSNQERVVKRKKNISVKGILPDINQFCKTKEQIAQELNDIENNYNEYYTEMKKKNEKNDEIKETYSTIIQEMNEKIVEVRTRMSTVENEKTRINLKKIIESNNLMLKKVKEITEFYDNIKESEEINDDMIFEWYKNYKMYQSEQLNLKCKNILKEVKKLLEENILKEIEKVTKKDSKVKPDTIKKYKDIITDAILELQLNEEIKTFFENIK